MVFERKRNYQLVLVFSLAGFFSGLITCVFFSPAHRLGDYGSFVFLGSVFGAILGLCLSIFGLLRGPWEGICVVIAGPCALFLSVSVAAQVEVTLPWETSSSGQPVNPSFVALFAGGFVGGCLLLGAISILVHLKKGPRTRAIKALTWSLVAGVFGGLLGVIGWQLGPSLGIGIWTGVHSLGLTPPDETIQNTIAERAHWYSLFVVWQTVMATVLAVMLWPYNAKPGEGNSNSLDV